MRLRGHLSFYSIYSQVLARDRTQLLNLGHVLLIFKLPSGRITRIALSGSRQEDGLLKLLGVRLCFALRYQVPNVLQTCSKTKVQTFTAFQGKYRATNGNCTSEVISRSSYMRYATEKRGITVSAVILVTVHGALQKFCIKEAIYCYAESRQDGIEFLAYDGGMDIRRIETVPLYLELQTKSDGTRISCRVI